MTLSEATRQYAIARAYHAQAKEQLEGVISMEDELADSEAQLKQAEKAMETAWMEHIDTASSPS